MHNVIVDLELLLTLSSTWCWDNGLAILAGPAWMLQLAAEAPGSTTQTEVRLRQAGSLMPYVAHQHQGNFLVDTRNKVMAAAREPVRTQPQ